MIDGLHRLPRLPALLTFEAAARFRSFTLAARELRVSQAAVSQQVRGLEGELGLALFKRLHRGLELTRDGQRLYRAVAMAFEHVAQTAEELRGARRSARVTIGVTFAVATFWLVPRLPRFRALHPEIDVHVVATDRGFDKVADRVDAGIAFGAGPWPGFTATLLREGAVFPVCSPDYLRRRPGLTRIEQLPGERLLSIDDDRPGLVDWPVWLAEHGITGYATHHYLKTNSHPLLLQAACEGQGIALGWTLLTDDLLAQGKLVRPVDAVLRTAKAFYFLAAERRASEEARAFRDWVLGFFPASERDRTPALQQARPRPPAARAHGEPVELQA
jgi:DNA-binding transcriptional LysR family regulator